MNIDKIYKPLKLRITTDGFHVIGISTYDIKEVIKLEEKYKELLENHIDLLNFTNKLVYASLQTSNSMKLIERHTGMKWEDIIAMDNSEQSSEQS